MVPGEVRELFRSNQPTAYSETPKSAFAKSELYGKRGGSSAASKDELWEHASDPEKIVSRCRQEGKDDNAWYSVVETVLSSCISLYNGEMDFDINNIQAQSIDRPFYPRNLSAAVSGLSARSAILHLP